MEDNGDGLLLLEELVNNIPFEMNYEFNNNNDNNNAFTFLETSSSFQDLFFDQQTPIDSSFPQHLSSPFGHHQPSAAQQDFDSQQLISMSDDGQNCHLLHDSGRAVQQVLDPCKSEPDIQPVFNVGMCLEKKNSKSKKLDGYPSKNLMAERRRRKRLNDRLSMLRSVVPKISKMDRTSILGDTIDYMKELTERINKMQEQIEVATSSNHIINDSKPNEILIRNSPKFNVERSNRDTVIEVCCMGKPGLLVSTMMTLEALGLDIQQCVISCFNDFAMHASCFQKLEHTEILSSEDIKQALFRNAGYGGKCL